MTRQELISLINNKQSFLCFGLDSDIEKIPQHLLKEEDPVFEFNKKIIDATLPYTVAYKPNLAFYESNGIKGLVSLKKTMDYLKDKRNECLIIADAKRGDIGNTSKQYAKSMLSKDGDFDFDAITIAPYMGKDSVMPFLYPNKWVILLALTSNEGAADFQYMEDKNGVNLFEKVLATAQQWETSTENLMFVCGATKAEKFVDIRKIVPEHFLLVPGVGAQGGSLQEVCKYGMNKDCGLLVNSSRGIIFADKTEDFYKVAGEKARELQQEMKTYLNK